jgi:type II secretory pathway pseudopilin PulG
MQGGDIISLLPAMAVLAIIGLMAVYIIIKILMSRFRDKDDLDGIF